MGLNLILRTIELDEFNRRPVINDESNRNPVTGGCSV
jgi:hypothetical protein